MLVLIKNLQEMKTLLANLPLSISNLWLIPTNN